MGLPQGDGLLSTAVRALTLRPPRAQGVCAQRFFAVQSPEGVSACPATAAFAQRTNLMHAVKHVATGFSSRSLSTSFQRILSTRLLNLAFSLLNASPQSHAPAPATVCAHRIACLFLLQASFGGAIGWQLSLFDVNKAKTWDEVVNALVSNTPERTDSVTLVFERPTPQ
eukprot:6183794-Pleurochrysis_carterae.AAC.3